MICLACHGCKLLGRTLLIVSYVSLHLTFSSQFSSKKWTKLDHQKYHIRKGVFQLIQTSCKTYWTRNYCQMARHWEKIRASPPNKDSFHGARSCCPQVQSTAPHKEPGVAFSQRLTMWPTFTLRWRIASCSRFTPPSRSGRRTTTTSLWCTSRRRKSLKRISERWGAFTHPWGINKQECAAPVQEMTEGSETATMAAFWGQLWCWWAK